MVMLQVLLMPLLKNKAGSLPTLTTVVPLLYLTVWVKYSRMWY